MKLIYAIVFMFCAHAFQAPDLQRADLKVTMKSTTAGRTIESTIYMKGSRQRTEVVGTASVYQCDLKRVIQINDRARKYFVARLDDQGAPATETEPAQPIRRGGVVTLTVTLTDTGERKQMFGYTARHILSTTVIDAPQGTCEPGRTEIESDGWYIDLPVAFNCSSDRPATPPRPSSGGCRDEIRFIRKGTARLGFPVLLTTRMKLAPEGEPMDSEEVAMMQRMMMTTLEVTDISSATLSPALFDLPAGYTEAASMSELYAYTGDQRPIGVPVGERIPPVSAPRSEEYPAPANVVTKRPGVIRIGLASINNNTERGLSLESLRQTLNTEISGANLEAVLLGTNSAAEAEHMGCDFILYTNVTALKQSTASKVGGIFGRVTGAGNPVGEKFEARVEFKLVSVPGGAPQLQSSATAKEGGANESVTAALVKEARAVADAVRKRN